jgi:hypothetical protein
VLRQTHDEPVVEPSTEKELGKLAADRPPDWIEKDARTIGAGRRIVRYSPYNLVPFTSVVKRDDVYAPVVALYLVPFDVHFVSFGGAAVSRSNAMSADAPVADDEQVAV